MVIPFHRHQQQVVPSPLTPPSSPSTSAHRTPNKIWDISWLYVDMPIALVHAFGIHVTCERNPKTGAPLNVHNIPRGVNTVPKLGVITIESDASRSAYPLAVSATIDTSCTGKRVSQGKNILWIRAIVNQWIKECNHIKVMKDKL
jgi:5-enolpyruvylshikimate-3-phosphate synthase